MDDVTLIKLLRERAAGAEDDARILRWAVQSLSEMDNDSLDVKCAIERFRLIAVDRSNDEHIMAWAAYRLEELAERVAIMEEGGVSSDMVSRITEGIDTIYGLLYMAKTVYRVSGKATAELDSGLVVLSSQVEDCARKLACIITDPEDAAELCIKRRLMVQEWCGGISSDR